MPGGEDIGEGVKEAFDAEEEDSQNAEGAKQPKDDEITHRFGNPSWEGSRTGCGGQTSARPPRLYVVGKS